MKAINNLSERSSKGLGVLADRVDWSNQVQARAVYARAYSALLNSGGRAVEQASIVWYNRVRAAELGETIAGVLSDPNTSSGLVYAAISWAFKDHEQLSPDQLRSQVMKRLGQYVGLHLRNRGRQAISDLVERDPIRPRWARVPRGRTCAWCSMLASRGWVYTSADTAGAVANSFHADCDCQIVPNWDKAKANIRGYDPEKLYADYREAFAAVRAELGEEDYPRDYQVATKMRHLFPEKYTDGVYSVLR